MRKENPELIYGDLKFTMADDQKMVLSYTRTLDNNEIIVVFNRSGQEQSVVVPVNNDGIFMDMLSGEGDAYGAADSKLEISLDPLSAIVLKKK